MSDSPPETGPRALRLRTVLVAAAVLLGLANAARYSGYVLDDSYIILRYAGNLVTGHGLVFNPGERVEGYTDFLYVLLTAFGLKAGAEPILFLKVLGVLAAAGTLLLLARQERGAWAVALLLPLEAFVYWAFCPMETMLFTALLTLAVLLATAERGGSRRGAVWVFVLLALTRPEGVLVFAAATAVLFFVDSRESGFTRAAVRRGGDVLTFLLPWGAYFAWRVLYYGELLPNTFHAKVTTPGGGLRDGLLYLGEWARAFPVLAVAGLAPLVLSRARLERRRPLPAAARPLAAVVLAYLVYVAAVGGDFMAFFRFVLPVMPVLALLSAWTLTSLFSDRVAATTCAASAVLALFTAQPYRAFVADRTAAVGLTVGRWLAEELPKDSLIAVNTAGAVPWASGLPTIDMLGLTDKAIARRPVFVVTPGWAGHRRGWGEYVLSRRPRAILWYNASGARDPYYLGDRELADDWRFRFFYHLKTRELPAPEGRLGRLLGRFYGTPFGGSFERPMGAPELGFVARLSRTPVPHTTVTEGHVLANVFLDDERDQALWEVAQATPRNPAAFVGAAADHWTASAPREVPDPETRRAVEAMCDEALGMIQERRLAQAGALLQRAVAQNGAARSPRVYQYLANVAVLAGDRHTAVAAQKEALRLSPESPLYRANLVNLLVTPSSERLRPVEERTGPR